MAELFLIYINYIGRNWRDEHVYEFIFSDVITDVDGEDWDVYPASGNPSPPNKDFIKRVGLMTSDLDLDVIQEDERFAVWDAVDGVVALAWENLDNVETYPESRLFFRFGEPIKSVEDKLYAHENEIILDYNYSKNEKLKG